MTRREFLMRAGAAGGYSAAFFTMQQLGLVPLKAATGSDLRAETNTGKGVRVVVLGAGMAGLVAAYELRKLGYVCTVLEARERAGGRNWSVRSGTKIVLDGCETQTCTFEPNNYQNVGPARLPSIHNTILGYCRTLGVELEVEINSSRSTLIQDDNVGGGKAFVQRQLVNDTRGHVAELLARSVAGGALDQELSVEDRKRILDFLNFYGPLSSDGHYAGSERSGYAQMPGAGDQVGITYPPLELRTLLDPKFWQSMMFDESLDMQPTMFQPKGGMDRIPAAFARELGDIVHYNSPVKEIRKTADGVWVVYTQDGADRKLEADYCFCALPLSILKNIPNDFSAPYQKVIAECVYAGAYKIAWEARRFWEQDYNIYGGISFLAQGCSPVWYPSSNLFSPRGVVLSGYGEEVGTPFGQLSMAEKFEASRASIERLHPGHGRELQKPIYVGWSRTQYNRGSWLTSYSKTGAKGDQPDPGYTRLTQPDDRITFIGDACSHLGAWQEGAALSAHRAVNLLNQRLRSS